MSSQRGYNYGSRGQPGITTSDAPPEASHAMIMLFLILVIVLCVCLGSRITRAPQVSPAVDTPERPQTTKEDTESRKKKILQCFEANNTSMIVKSSDLQLKSRTVKISETTSPKVACQNDRDVDLEAAMPVTMCTDEKDGKDAIPLENNTKDELTDLEKGAATMTDDDDGYEDGVLFMPQREALQPKKSVPNLCAICLDAYRPGDAVVWSNNPQCCHAFHETCLVHYLVKVKSGRAPCPTCRQCFVLELEPNTMSLKKTESDDGNSTSWGLAAFL